MPPFYKVIKNYTEAFKHYFRFSFGEVQKA